MTTQFHFSKEVYHKQLLNWFFNQGRHDLPWQRCATPYATWVSEVMLQQTQVATVKPYFERFMQRFQTIESLAEASQDTVLNYWSGLGYYARGRNLHKAAKKMVQDHHSQVPNTPDALLALPGIGQSTANAILSLAFNQPLPILDGNVKRVFARLFALQTPIDTTETEQLLWHYANALMHHDQPAAYTQAQMDLGALVCQRKPLCQHCPLTNFCLAYQQKIATQLPYKKPKRAKTTIDKTYGCYYHQGKIWLSPFKQTGVWGGMYGLPVIELKGQPEEYLITHLGQGRHVFTHFYLNYTVYLIEVNDFIIPDDQGQWIDLTDYDAYPIPKVFTQYFARLVANC